MTMKQCVGANISIEAVFPSSSYLFRCLRSPLEDPFGLLIATAALMTNKSPIEDICALFRKISVMLKGLHPIKAAALLRPIESMAIFPIIVSPGRHKHEELLSALDASWFIADRPLLHKSFHGVLPLLAFPTKDIIAFEDLLRAFKLDKRFLSKLTITQTLPVGLVKENWAWTSALQAKKPFIIP